MKKAYQITSQGRQELEAELQELKNRRGAIAEKIAEARDYGDLSENAEYDSAREEQGLVETRVAEIEDILMNAEEIKSRKSNKVQLGSTVELKNGSKQFSYKLVGPVEADPMSGKISNESPIGIALVGKIVGDEAVINTPKGSTTYTVVSIS